TRICCHRCEQRGVRDAEADFLPFHVPARLSLAHALVRSGEEWIALRLRPAGRGHGRQEKERHRRPYCPAMSLRASHPAQGVSEARRNREDQHHFQEVRKWRRVFKRMCAVRVEKSAAVRSKFLNNFL